MGQILDIIIYQPFSWLLLTLYNFTSSYGLAIILFCLLTKLALLPFSMKSKKGMMQQAILQPKIAEAQKKFANDKQKQQEAVAKIYQDSGSSPLGGCLWSLLPFPIFIALFAVVREPVTRLMGLTGEAISVFTDSILPSLGLQIENQSYIQLELANHIHEHFNAIQAYVNNPANVEALKGVDFSGLMNIDFTFLGLNLTVFPTLWPLSLYIIIPILSGAAAYFSQKIAQKSSAVSAASQSAANPSSNMVLKLMPLMSVWFGFIMPAAMGVYWIFNSLFGMIQDYFLGKYYGKKFEEEQSARDAKLERQRLAEDAAKEEIQKKREESQDYQKQLAKERRRAEFEANSSASLNAPGGRPKKGKKKASGKALSAAERIAAAEKTRISQSQADAGGTGGDAGNSGLESESPEN